MNILEHLKDRHFQIERYSGVYYDDDTAWFPLWNLSGQMVGYQQYRPFADKTRNNDPKNGRYYTYRTKETDHPGNRETKKIGVFGVETLLDKSYRSDIMFITEGVFDIVRIHNLNIAGIAALSNDPQYLLPWLFILPYYRIVARDNDDAGKKLSKIGHRSIISIGSKDLGDMDNNELTQFMKDFI